MESCSDCQKLLDIPSHMQDRDKNISLTFMCVSTDVLLGSVVDRGDMLCYLTTSVFAC